MSTSALHHTHHFTWCRLLTFDTRYPVPVQCCGDMLLHMCVLEHACLALLGSAGGHVLALFILCAQLYAKVLAVRFLWGWPCLCFCAGLLAPVYVRQTSMVPASADVSNWGFWLENQQCRAICVPGQPLPWCALVLRVPKHCLATMCARMSRVFS